MPSREIKACREHQNGLQGHQATLANLAKASNSNTELTKGNRKLCNKHGNQQQEAHRRSELAHYNQGIQLCVVDDHADTGMRRDHVPPPPLSCNIIVREVESQQPCHCVRSYTRSAMYFGSSILEPPRNCGCNASGTAGK